MVQHGWYRVSFYSSFHGVLSKVFVRDQVYSPLHPFSVIYHRGFHRTQFLKGVDEGADNPNQTETKSAQDSSKNPKRKKLKGKIDRTRFSKGVDEGADNPNQTETKSAQDSSTNPKRKKLKGKIEGRRWLRQMRNEKKITYQHMTDEEKILSKLSKARKKEATRLESLKKLEPKEYEAVHDPEVLTQEEHFYFLKMGRNCKNYVPVGRRGVYQGVILNMHLHWKKHETLQVIVKTFTPEEVKDIAVELAKLSGGIVLGFIEDETIIMYRGKNYSPPLLEIISARITLPRIKAFHKSNLRQELREVRIFIRKLEQKLDILRARHQHRRDHTTEHAEDASKVDTQEFIHASKPNSELAPSDKLIALLDEYRNNVEEDGSMADATTVDSESEDLSDMFETDSDSEGNTDTERSFSNINDPKRAESSSDSPNSAELNEVDQIFVRAAELLKKRRQ